MARPKKIAQAEPQPGGEIVARIPIPAWMRDEAIDLRTEHGLAHDLRLAVSAFLGEMYTLRDGLIVAASGREFTLEVACEELTIANA